MDELFFFLVFLLRGYTIQRISSVDLDYGVLFDCVNRLLFFVDHAGLLCLIVRVSPIGT
jgi:hypothetical protein